MMDFLREIRAPNVKIIYHAHCLDGLFAAWAVSEYVDLWSISSSREERAYSAHPWKYGDPPPLEENTHLIVVDFSFPPEQLAELPEGCHVTILDHHETAIKAWSRDGENATRVLVERGNVVAYLDQTRSGAGLAYSTFVDSQQQPAQTHNVMRTLTLAVEDRDLWKFAWPDTREFCRALKELTASSTPGSLMRDLDGFPLSAIKRLGAGLLAADKKEIEHLCASRSVMLADSPIHALPVPMINYMGPLLSELLNYARDLGDANMAVAYIIEKDKVTFSLRSAKNGPNVATIAARWGGGGHAHAAGFRCSLEHFHDLFLYKMIGRH